MAWYFQSAEFWLGLVLLAVTIAAIVCAVFSKKPDSHMEFFLRLIESASSEKSPLKDDSETIKETARDIK